MAAITVVFIAAIALTALFFAGASGKDTLVLRDGDTKEEYARFPVSEGDEFSVTFIHSVNQYPLTDVYEIRDHRIYVVRTIYNNFGTGVQTEIEEGQKLEYGENGEMIVSGFDREMPWHRGDGFRPCPYDPWRSGQLKGALRKKQQGGVLL